MSEVVQIVLRILVSLAILGAAYYGLQRTWRNKIDITKILAAPSQVIPVKDEVPEVSLEYGFVSSGLEYEPGVEVDGITWQASFRRVLFVLNNKSSDVALLDWMAELSLPVTVMAVSVSNQQGCQDVAVSQRLPEAGVPAKSGKSVPMEVYSNCFSISCPRMASGGSLSVSLIYLDTGIHSDGYVDLKYTGEGSEPVRVFKAVAAHGEVPRHIRIDHDAPPPTQGRLGISFGPPRSRKRE